MITRSLTEAGDGDDENWLLGVAQHGRVDCSGCLRLLASCAVCALFSQVARTWKIRNPDVINPICRAPVAYKLFPLGCESGMCLDEEGEAFG